nr:MAG TPA: hypothetical protein [Caudoviricetes sp.]
MHGRLLSQQSILQALTYKSEANKRRPVVEHSRVKLLSPRV